MSSQDCSNCCNSGNEPSEGVCAGCFRSMGIEDMYEPLEGMVQLDIDYVIDDKENGIGC